MKKIAIVIFLFLLLGLSRCGKVKSVVCTMVQEFEVGYVLESKKTTTVKDGLLVPAVLTITMTFEEEEVAKFSYENLKKEYENDANTSVSINGKVITIIEQDSASEAIDRQDFINAYQEDGFTCE